MADVPLSISKAVKTRENTTPSAPSNVDGTTQDPTQTAGNQPVFTKVNNSSAVTQFQAATPTDSIQFAAGIEASVSFDSVNKRVTFDAERGWRRIGITNAVSNSSDLNLSIYQSANVTFSRGDQQTLNLIPSPYSPARTIPFSIRFISCTSEVTINYSNIVWRSGSQPTIGNTVPDALLFFILQGGVVYEVGSSLDGGGSSVTASGGLTKVGDDIRLGGTLIDGGYQIATPIAADAYYFEEVQYFPAFVRHDRKLYSADAVDRYFSFQTAFAGTDTAYYYIQAGVLNGDVVQFTSSASVADNYSFLFQDDIRNKGAEYGGDYEANFTARSLVTKQYVDDAVGNISPMLESSSNTLKFDNYMGYIHGNAGALSGALTLDFTGAIRGASVTVIHNDSTNPLTALTKIKTIAGYYSLTDDNYITITLINTSSGTEVLLASIGQE